MTLEEFKKEIESKFESQIRGLNQQITNRDYKIKQLQEEIVELKKEGKHLWENASEFKALLNILINDEGFRLPDSDNRFDTAARLFGVEVSDDRPR